MSKFSNKLTMVRRVRSYILFLKVKNNLKTKIGALGKKEFLAGYYLYVGSGRKNLMERIRRHLKMKKKRFWHIDYLLTKKNVSIVDIYLSERTESEIVNRVHNLNDVNLYLNGFGSSDTDDKTHLFYLRDKEIMKQIIKSFEKW